MADAPALRVKRSRLHKAGDHSMCHPERCDAAAGVTPAAERVTGAGRNGYPAPPATVADLPKPPTGPAPGEPEPEHVPGPIENMARAFVDALPYAPGDSRRMLGELAVALARRVDDDGAVPASVRELRTLLTQLVEIPSQQAGVVDELRVKRAHRRLDGILAQADVYLAQARAV